MRPGGAYRDIGGVIEEYTKSKGFSVVRTYCGHGINELVLLRNHFGKVTNLHNLAYSILLPVFLTTLVIQFNYIISAPY